MIRCRECDQSNPEDHRFCGMCGAKLEPKEHSLDISDDDPLELETPVYQFEDRTRLHGQSEVSQQDLQREQVRDTSSIRSNGGRGSRRIADVGTLPREIIEPTVENEYSRGNRKESAGIGGPSFLGLNYEAESNRGFVYDKPRQDGFVYDTDGQAPEYLLEEIPRGVSWRAWALFLLLIIGGGLGYIQWRASHHQGPDLASILARNGPTVDPSGPVMPDKSAKPADKTNTGDSSNAANAKDNSQPAESKNAAGSSDADNDEHSSVINAESAAKSSDAKTGTAKAAAKTDDAKAQDRTEESRDAANSKSAAKNNDSDEDETSAKPESDGPVAKSAKTAHKREVVDEEPPQPKSLGEKDPLIIQADKYIQGRGVRKNCSTGINLLRQSVSEGNPAASVKLGALYWSGTCVTQSKVTAYQWFSRAHSLEPKNRWIERSRNSLWASMSPSEQRRVGY